MPKFWSRKWGSNFSESLGGDWECDLVHVDSLLEAWEPQGVE